MSKKTKYCPVCGAELDINAIICTTCGERILGDVRAQTQNEVATGNRELTKQCPFCGEEININAVKCKYCKNFIEKEDQAEDDPTVWGTIFNTIAAFVLTYIIGCFVLPFIIGVAKGFMEGFTSSAHVNSNSTAYTEVKPDGVYGSYSGFGKDSSYDVNLGDIAYDCTENGVGISLTEQLEGFFAYNVEAENEKYPYFYEMKRANPRIEFNISNPKWEKDSFDIYRDFEFCRADIDFSNIPSNTVMGYSQGQYFTLEDAYCSVVYRVSRQGKKYKAIIYSPSCEPNYGYR